VRGLEKFDIWNFFGISDCISSCSSWFGFKKIFLLREGIMITRSIVVLFIFVLMLFPGGCGKGDDTSGEEPAAGNALEDYSSTLLNSLDKSKKAQIQASLPTIRLQINQFKQDNARYPESLEELTMPDIPLHLLSYDAETGEVGLK
jgi:hypothetical protein